MDLRSDWYQNWPHHAELSGDGGRVRDSLSSQLAAIPTNPCLYPYCCSSRWVRSCVQVIFQVLLGSGLAVLYRISWAWALVWGLHSLQVGSYLCWPCVSFLWLLQQVGLKHDITIVLWSVCDTILLEIFYLHWLTHQLRFCPNVAARWD